VVIWLHSTHNTRKEEKERNDGGERLKATKEENKMQNGEARSPAVNLSRSCGKPSRGCRSPRPPAGTSPEGRNTIRGKKREGENTTHEEREKEGESREQRAETDLVGALPGSRHDEAQMLGRALDAAGGRGQRGDVDEQILPCSQLLLHLDSD
jgi:hypothetical protein